MEAFLTARTLLNTFFAQQKIVALKKHSKLLKVYSISLREYDHNYTPIKINFLKDKSMVKEFWGILVKKMC